LAFHAVLYYKICCHILKGGGPLPLSPKFKSEMQFFKNRREKIVIFGFEGVK